MMKAFVVLFCIIQVSGGIRVGPYGSSYYNPFQMDKFVFDFFTTFNNIMNMKTPAPRPQPSTFLGAQLFPPTFTDFSRKNSGFKTVHLNDMKPGTRKTFKMNNGQGVAFRSRDGNAGGMSFSSGTGGGNGFAFGGTLNRGSNGGEFVMSRSGPKGTKVSYSKDVPKFAKNLFRSFSFF